MDTEREEIPTYKVNADLGELVSKDKHYNRLYPELSQWRTNEAARVYLEANSDEERIRLEHASIQAEFEAFP